ncbi:MAG: hypothetical protein HY717_10880 [Planctomycetes bacterium]|nr:hypothetical protein [Planctomycetota bacterium]
MPPAVLPRPVYYTYPGYPAEFRIEAMDPEGGHLLFHTVDFPLGASLEEETGLVRWTPSEEQIGPNYLSFTVSDEAVPPNRVGGLLVFQVYPVDGCVRPECDPARGCEPGLAPLTESCCGGPGTRVPEPEVGCPEGRVLHAGRNPAGSPSIRRLQNCDLLRLIPLGQGGYGARLNLEARCLAPEQILVKARLETAGSILFDESARLNFETRADGFIQVLGLRFIAEGTFSDGMEAQLTIAVTDADGERIERKLRLILTRGAVPDLP